jgi:hypothetical protein
MSGVRAQRRRHDTEEPAHINLTFDPTATGPSEREVADWQAFDKAVKDAGVFVHEAGLQPVEEARTITIRDGEIANAAGGIAPRPGVTRSGAN